MWGIFVAIENVAVIIPVIRKISTEVKDRGESRGRPQRPWPLVQPDPSWVPKPTNAPEIINWRFVPVTILSNGIKSLF